MPCLCACLAPRRNLGCRALWGGPPGAQCIVQDAACHSVLVCIAGECSTSCLPVCPPVAGQEEPRPVHQLAVPRAERCLQAQAAAAAQGRAWGWFNVPLQWVFSCCAARCPLLLFWHAECAVPTCHAGAAGDGGGGGKAGGGCKQRAVTRCSVDASRPLRSTQCAFLETVQACKLQSRAVLAKRLGLSCCAALAGPGVHRTPEGGTCTHAHG